MDDLRNFNESFRKDVTYDNIQSKKKQNFSLFLEDTLLSKSQRWVKLTPPPAFFRLNHAILLILPETMTSCEENAMF